MKVFIPAAGAGLGLGGITKYINKTLVSMGGKPTLSRIIEMFPADTDFVIATGYKGDIIKEYLHLAHPEKKIQFVDILLYDGEGSGLGLTMLDCKQYLQEPFVLCAADLLISSKLPELRGNFMAYDNRDAKEIYRTVQIDEDGNVSKIGEKGEDTSRDAHPYVGLAGIHDYKEFWEAMDSGDEKVIKMGEGYGLNVLLQQGVTIRAEKVTWYDMGAQVELDASRKIFENPDAPNILEKANETIWFLDNKVIKFSDNTRFISDRVKRAKMLKEFVPPVTGNTTHMYSYDYVQGDVLSKCISIPLFDKLLNFSKDFWIVRELDKAQKTVFKEQCMSFYRRKTYDRVELFYKNFKKKDNADIINGVKYPTLKEILDSIDWDYLADGLPGQFHGDYHFENILYDQENDTFKFLDWRQNFGKLLSTGDIYYDLAKLNHGLIICHELIAKDSFTATWAGNEIKYDFARKQSLVECEQHYYKWLIANGYDMKKVKMMTAMIFLNICALHDYPYVLLLYGLGKEMMYECLNNII